MRRSFTFPEILVLGVWIGLLGGFAEVGMLGIARFGFHRAMHAEVDVIWAIPISLAVLGGLIAIPAGLLARTRVGKKWPALSLWFLALLAAGNLSLAFFQVHPAAKLLLSAGVAVQAALFMSRRQNAFVRAAKRTVLPLLGVVAVFAVGAEIFLRLREARLIAALPSATPGAPNVILIVLDTERALDLSLYGYGRRTTATLERLADESVVFDRAYASSSWTLSSHASMFTGRLPQELGVDWLTPLNADHATLAESFADRGYLTAAFSANNFFVTRPSGLARGFAHFEGHRITPLTVLLRSAVATRLASQRFRGQLFNSYQIPARKQARHLTGDVLGWLESADSDRPRFVFINYFDAHNPYLPPTPFDTAFIGRRSDWNVRNPMLAMPTPVQLRDAVAERVAYDQAIAAQDAELGVLLTRLEENGGLRNTILAITADHGEEFGEHGLLEHGGSLNPASLWVPLLLRDPVRRFRGVRIGEVVFLIDLPATLLTLADSTRSSELPGASLLSHLGPPKAASRGFAIAELPRGIGQPAWSPVSNGPLRSVTSGSWHYVRDADGRETLMDLTGRPEGRLVDPGLPEYREDLTRMRALLDSAIAGGRRGK